MKKLSVFKKDLIIVFLYIFTGCFGVWFLDGCTDGGIKPDVKPVDPTKDTIIIKPDTIIIEKDTLPKETDTAKAAYRIQKIFENVPAVLAMTNGVQTIKLDLKEGVDNSEYLQGVIDNVPNDGRVAYSVGNGNYFFSKTIKIHNKSIWIIGTNGSVFTFPGGVSGIQITRDHYIYPCLLQNLDLVAQSNTDSTANGIEVQSITHMMNVNVLRFGGYGIRYVADIGSGRSDVSKSVIFNCEVIQCRYDGFYFQGGDANACSVVFCSSRDVGGIGFHDSSFLGNGFWGNMAHNSAKGHYRADGDNNRSVFASCYAEEDSPPSLFGGVARVYGGNFGWPLKQNPDGSYVYAETGEAYRGVGSFLVYSPWAKVDTH
jgi:hypothetical protein